MSDRGLLRKLSTVDEYPFNKDVPLSESPKEIITPVGDGVSGSSVFVPSNDGGGGRGCITPLKNTVLNLYLSLDSLFNNLLVSNNSLCLKDNLYNISGSNMSEPELIDPSP